MAEGERNPDLKNRATVRGALLGLGRARAGIGPEALRVWPAIIEAAAVLRLANQPEHGSDANSSIAHQLITAYINQVPIGLEIDSIRAGLGIDHRGLNVSSALSAVAAQHHVSIDTVKRRRDEHIDQLKWLLEDTATTDSNAVDEAVSAAHVRAAVDDTYAAAHGALSVVYCILKQREAMVHRHEVALSHVRDLSLVTYTRAVATFEYLTGPSASAQAIRTYLRACDARAESGDHIGHTLQNCAEATAAGPFTQDLRVLCLNANYAANGPAEYYSLRHQAQSAWDRWVPLYEVWGKNELATFSNLARSLFRAGWSLTSYGQIGQAEHVLMHQQHAAKAVDAAVLALVEFRSGRLDLQKSTKAEYTSNFRAFWRDSDLSVRALDV